MKKIKLQIISKVSASVFDKFKVDLERYLERKHNPNSLYISLSVHRSILYITLKSHSTGSEITRLADSAITYLLEYFERDKGIELGKTGRERVIRDSDNDISSIEIYSIIEK